MVRIILLFLSILPFKVNYFFGVALGKILYLINGKLRRVVDRNITLCFGDLNYEQQQNLVKKNLIEAGKGFTELGFIWFRGLGKNSTYIKQVNGIENIDNNKAVILLTPHFGCWEITGRFVALIRKVTFLYKPPNNNKKNNFLLEKRAADNLFMAATNIKGIVKLKRALSKNEAIGILPDQDPGTKGGVMATFFNYDVNTMTLLVKLARKHNANVVMTYAKRLHGANGYELNFNVVDVLSKTGYIKDDVNLMNKAIEELILTNPEQYLWSYKRFKSIINYD